MLRVNFCCLEISLTPLILITIKSFPWAWEVRLSLWVVWIFLFWNYFKKYLLSVMSIGFLLGSVLLDEFFRWFNESIFAFLFVFELKFAFDFVHDSFFIFSTSFHDVLQNILLSYLLRKKFTLALSWEQVLDFVQSFFYEIETLILICCCCLLKIYNNLSIFTLYLLTHYYLLDLANLR